MSTITISLPDDRMSRLCELAAQNGLSPEELLSRQAEHWLARPVDEFTQTAAAVLRKNTERYRRLA